MSKYFYITLFFIIACVTGCSESKSNISIEKSNIQYEKPGTSDQVIEGNKVDYELWYNNNQWKIYGNKDSNSNIPQEESKNKNKLLTNASNDVYVSIQETHDTMSYGESFKHYSKWIKRQGGQIINKEIRFVNGNDILFIEALVHSESKPLKSINYVLTNNSGGVSITVAVPEDLFEQYELDIFNLLNGLVGPNVAASSTESSETK